MATVTKIAVPAREARNWNLRLPSAPVYYHRDDEETSHMQFTPFKAQAERFTLAEAEHFVRVARSQGHPQFSIVSAGGEG